MENGDDEEVIGRVLAGRTDQYGLLVERYQGMIFNLMYRFCRSRQQAADLSQEVFLRAYERLESFDGSKKFFPWLYTLALNLARDWQRKKKRRLAQLEELRWHMGTAVSGRKLPEEEVMETQETRRLYRALDLLEEETREILLARYCSGLTIREIAAIFGLGESAVKMRISRSLDRLQDLLEEQGP